MSGLPIVPSGCAPVRFGFRLAAAERDVQLSIYEVQGRKLRTVGCCLLDLDIVEPGGAGSRRCARAACERARWPVCEPLRSGAPAEPDDVGGRFVRNLAQGMTQPGHYLRFWDRRDEAGSQVARGVYVIRLRAGAVGDRKKLVLVSD